MPKLTLYSYWRSSCSYRVRIALNLIGLDYAIKPVHLVKNGGEQFSLQFIKLNPKAEVPVFEDGQVRLSQSMAIILYLDQQFQSLFPQEERFLCLEMCEVINSGIQPLQNLKVLNYLSQQFPGHQGTQWCAHWIGEGLRALEKKLQDLDYQNFPFEEKAGAFECFLIPQMYNAERFGLNMDSIPKLRQLWQSCLELKPFQSAHPQSQPDCPQ